MKNYRELFHDPRSRLILISIISSLLLVVAFLFIAKRLRAAPSTIVDTSTATATSYPGNRRIIRTTAGSNSKRVFVLVSNGTDQVIYYTDDAEASSPSWSNLTFKTGTTHRVADMVWDETNNVIYICYARGTLANNNNADVFYKRLSDLGSNPPTLGAEQTVFDGSSGGTTYNSCNIEIAGDSGTNKVFVFTSAGTAGGNISSMLVKAGTLNSDAPTFTSAHTIKSWTAAAGAGAMTVTRYNTDKLALMYYNGTDMMATRHDDSASATSTSGWDALDGTDNSETTISSDDPPGSQTNPGASAVGSNNSNIVWFGWVDTGNDINTRRWNGSSLDTEQTPIDGGVATLGPAFSTDGAILYMFYRSTNDTTQAVFQSRPMSDGSSSWSGTETVLYDHASESITYPNSTKKLYQGKADLIFTTSATDLAVHASSYQISGNIYQESVSSPYEGTTVWSGCDSATENIAVSIAGGTKKNIWCDSSTGAYSFVLAQPTSSDSDITIFLDTGGGNKAALFTHNNDTISDMTGLTLYKDRIVIRSESSSSITNADINSYDQSNDSDIPIASDGTTATADSGTKILINTGDTYAPGGAVTTPKLHIKGTYTGASETLTLNGSGSSSTCDDTLTNIRPLCIDSGTFTSSSNTTLFSGSSTSLIQNATYNLLRLEPGGNSVTHTLMAGTTTVNDNLTIGNGTNTGVTITAAPNSTTLTVAGNFAISANTTFVANSSNTTSIGGNWSNAGTFTHSSGTVLLNAGATGKTIDSGGTTSAKTFYNLTFNNGSGGWTVQTNNLKVANNLTITDVSALTVASSINVEVNGTYSIADAETAATTWSAGSVLYLNSGTSYTVGSKSQSTESYVTLQIGANTDIRTWQSSATTTTVDASGSLYSQDHAAVDGDVYIWGDYHTETNDYWSYATDFDGSALGGSSRQVDVRIDPSGNITVDSGDTLAAIGGASNRTSISRQGGSGGYGFTVSSGGTINFQYSDFDYLDGPYGLNIQAGATVTSLDNTKFDNMVDSATDAFITVASSVIGSGNKTLSNVEFNNTGSFANCNINRTGTDDTGYWDFDISTGTFDGEDYDCKDGANEADPGMLRWDDSGSGAAPFFNFQGLNMEGINID